MSSNFLVFHTSGSISSPATFLFLIFFNTKSSSCVNCSILMSSWLLTIFAIGLSVTFGGFPSKSTKCCFYGCIRSSWQVAFSLALAVLFLLFTSFTTVCHAILNCLSLIESNLIDLILYVFCLFFSVYVSKLIWCLLKFLAIDIGWVPPIAWGSGFYACTLFSNR